MELLPDYNVNNIIDNYKNSELSAVQEKIKSVNKDDDEKLMEVCKEFESIFIYMMLKEMKKTIPEDGLIEKSQAMKIFEDMYFEELSKEMSKGNNSLGIAKMIYEQFKNKSVKI
ncbi:MAG TPA: rod-binding protein [Tissierellaceae bacterium]